MGSWFWVLFLFVLPHLYWACIGPHSQAAAACDYSAQICGGVPIPFPFGMTSECGLPNYRISCKVDFSYGNTDQKPFLQVGTASTPELQVLNFSNTSNTITVNSTDLKAMPNSTGCWGVQDGVATLNLSTGGPLVLSDGNLFAVIGCNSSGSCTDCYSHSDTPSEQRFNVECSPGCYNQYDFAFCNDYACCSNPIPSGSRCLKFTGNGIAYADFPGLCGFSALLNPSTYNLAQNQSGFFGAGQFGMSISWALILNSSENCSSARTRPDYACSDYAECVYDSHVPGYTCKCSDGFRGDGYNLGIGCEDINECEEGLDNCEAPPLGNCTNTLGSFNCSCAKGTTGSGLPGTCVAHSKINVVLPTVLGGIAGAFCLSAFIIIVCISRRAYRRKQERKENFYRNGGEELRAILFSEDQLKRITNNFSRDHELGRGGYGTVYWGELPTNNRKVAIKKAKHMEDAEREEDQVKSFVSEILLLGKTTHENVVRLLGCCVETRVPLLVYEFIENGTLWDHLHPSRSEPIGGGSRGSLLGGSWARRLHIAVGAAEALSYLHNMNPPILHRDIKSNNILIDKSYSAKVADFGASRFLTSGATHLTFASVVGTHGYLDPEYHRSCQFTEKSDVYSFGVVLLELITGLPADLGTSLGVLAHHFHSHFRMKTHTDLIDARLETDADVLASIQDVAEVAMECVAMEGSQRPSMEVVLGKLKRDYASRRGPLSLQDHSGVGAKNCGSSTGTSSGMYEKPLSSGSGGDSEEKSLLAGSYRGRQYAHLFATTSTTGEISLSSSSDWS